jgi:hypothetical protein
MKRAGLFITLVVFGLNSENAVGQNVTVQLPTFQVFSVATTVVVPDRGTAYLGGVNRAAYGSTTSGVPGLSRIPGVGRLFTNRGIGSEVSSSGAHVAATIMDFEEMDRAVLEEAAARRGVFSAASVDPAVERKAAFISRNIAKNDRSKIKSTLPGPSRRRQ